MDFLEFGKEFNNFILIIGKILPIHGCLLGLDQCKLMQEIFDGDVLAESDALLIEGEENMALVKVECELQHLFF
jgi:hypothetical protein